MVWKILCLKPPLTHHQHLLEELAILLRLSNIFNILLTFLMELKEYKPMKLVCSYKSTTSILLTLQWFKN